MWVLPEWSGVLAPSVQDRAFITPPRPAEGCAVKVNSATVTAGRVEGWNRPARVEGQGTAFVGGPTFVGRLESRKSLNRKVTWTDREQLAGASDHLQTVMEAVGNFAADSAPII